MPTTSTLKTREPSSRRPSRSSPQLGDDTHPDGSRSSFSKTPPIPRTMPPPGEKCGSSASIPSPSLTNRRLGRERSGSSSTPTSSSRPRGGLRTAFWRSGRFPASRCSRPPTLLSKPIGTCARPNNGLACTVWCSRWKSWMSRDPSSFPRTSVFPLFEQPPSRIQARQALLGDRRQPQWPTLDRLFAFACPQEPQRRRASLKLRQGGRWSEASSLSRPASGSEGGFSKPESSALCQRLEAPAHPSRRHAWKALP
jgi:hypothetical protein